MKRIWCVCVFVSDNNAGDLFFMLNDRVLSVSNALALTNWLLTRHLTCGKLFRVKRNDRIWYVIFHE